jgi:DNA-binding XRE family transcriptional regulator
MDEPNSTQTRDKSPTPAPVITTSLKRARLKRAADLGRDVTQEEMAQEVGVHRSKYSGLELGTYEPSRALAEKIAAVTGQTPGEVIDEYLGLRRSA